jgi:hypothetical protein
MELRPLVAAQRRQEIRFDLTGEGPKCTKLPLSLGSDLHELPAAVLGIAATLDESPLLQLVEEAHELAAVVAESVRDGALSLV